MIWHNGIGIDRVRYTISHRGKTKHFKRQKNATAFRLWEALIIGECTRAQLFEILYGDDVEGGPTNGYNILNVKVSHGSRHFAEMDLRWISEKRAGIAHWRLVPVPLAEARAA